MTTGWFGPFRVIAILIATLLLVVPANASWQYGVFTTPTTSP